jgi:hypothetical protein
MSEQQQRTISTSTMPMYMVLTPTLIEQCGDGRRPLRARTKRS